jgi:L-cystine uptake protein TcyP (sodium:dicarboxylate symporter family)
LTANVIILARNKTARRKKMPDIFKALATITAWILWIAALVMGFSTFIVGTIAGDLFSTTEVEPVGYAISFAVAGFYAILAVVIMILRKKMEK